MKETPPPQRKADPMAVNKPHSTPVFRTRRGRKQIVTWECQKETFWSNSTVHLAQCTVANNTQPNVSGKPTSKALKGAALHRLANSWWTTLVLAGFGKSCSPLSHPKGCQAPDGVYRSAGIIASPLTLPYPSPKVPKAPHTVHRIIES